VTLKAARKSLFSLKGIESDPFSNCVIILDQEAQLQSFNLDGVAWQINTDMDGRLYGILKNEGATVKATLFTNQAHNRESLVSSGSLNGTQGIIELFEENYSGLSGVMTVSFKQNTKFEIAAVPELFSWRLTALRQNWNASDRPKDYCTKDSSASHTAVIDPDLIGPDDFRKPFPKQGETAPDGAFDLWLKRRRWVDNELQHLELLKQPDGTPDFSKLIDRMYSAIDTYAGAGPAPWRKIEENQEQVELETLYVLLDQADKTEFENYRELIKTHLNLTLEAFKSLFRIKIKYDNHEVVGFDEWQSVYAILIQAIKVSLNSYWREEEQKIEGTDKHEILCPAYFWISNREPEEGNWPPEHLNTYPMIDPEIKKVSSLPKHLQGKAGMVILEKRETGLEWLINDIKKKRENNSLDEALKMALGHPDSGNALQHKWDELHEDLHGGEPERKNDAKRLIVNDFYMSIENFDFMTDIIKRVSVGSGGPVPSEAEWNKVYSIMKTAFKRKRLYSEWKNEEKGIPIVDPDAIDESDLPEQTAGSRSLSWIVKRREQIKECYEKLWQSKKNGFADVVKEAVGEWIDLPALNSDLNGSDPEKVKQSKIYIWDELKLSLEDFSRLVGIIAKNSNNAPICSPTLEEWKQIVSILKETKKQKTLYSSWLDEEKPISASGYWNLCKARLPAWRANTDQRLAWQEALRQRSGPAVVDPDVFGPERLRFTIKEDAKAGAFRLHEQRADDLHKKRGSLKQSHEQAMNTGKGAEWIQKRLQADDLVHDGSIIVHALGISEVEFETLKSGKLTGKDLAARSAQFGLTPFELSNLIKAYQLAEQGIGIDEFWEEIYGTLIEIEKFCWINPIWKQEEINSSIIVGPDHFVLAPDDALSSINAPNSESSTCRKWRLRAHNLHQTLKSRIEQENAIFQSLAAANDSVEKEAFPEYRNQILRVYGDHGICVGDPATWVNQHLLVDVAGNAIMYQKSE
jgi:hypothetical protein